MNENCISVIVPMYNSEKTISDTIFSIINQSDFYLIREIIVINDGSKDKSRSIVESIVKSYPIVKLVNQDNKGVSNARNTGMSLASGEWIAFCDSDDLWTPDKIRIQKDIIDSNDIDLLGGNYLNKDLKICFKTINSLHKATSKELCIKMFPQTSTIIMKKKIYDEIGGFDETMSHYEDGDYLLKIVGKYRYYYFPQKIVKYGGERICGGTGLSSNTDKMNKGEIIALKHTFERHDISLFFYCVMRIFYVIKRIRRIIILLK